MARAINAAGLELIKSFESFRADPYRDEVGVWTIGYGHTQGVTPDMSPVTEADADQLLAGDLRAAEESVCESVTVSLGDNQYAALVSLVFNVGPIVLGKTLGKMLNSGNYGGAAQEFLRWRLAGGLVSDGLVRRREAERELFLTPDEEPATHNID